MNFLRKRERLVESIPLMALFAGINAIFSLIGALTPLGSIFMMAAIPLASVFVVLTTKYRYYPIYAAATLGVSIAVSAWNFQNTIFYILPAITIGFAYGVLISHKLPSPISLAGLALIETGLFALSLLLIRGLFGIDMKEVLFSLAHIENKETGNTIFPLFCLAYSSAQVAIIHLVVEININKFGIEKPNDKAFLLWVPIISIGFGILSLIFAFFSLKVAYFMFGLAIMFTCFSVPENEGLIRKRFFIMSAVSLVVFIMIFAAAYSKLAKNVAPLLFLALFVLIDLSIFINTLIEKKAVGQ